MIVALTYVGISLAVLAMLTFVYVIEDHKGERIFLLNHRDKLDGLLRKGIGKIESLMFSLTNNVVRLLLHYGAHSVLKRALAFIKSAEEKVEALVRKNRRIAKSISALREKKEAEGEPELQEKSDTHTQV
jgi:hypothetical protein